RDGLDLDLDLVSARLVLPKARELEVVLPGAHLANVVRLRHELTVLEDPKLDLGVARRLDHDLHAERLAGSDVGRRDDLRHGDLRLVAIVDRHHVDLDARRAQIASGLLGATGGLVPVAEEDDASRAHVLGKRREREAKRPVDVRALGVDDRREAEELEVALPCRLLDARVRAEDHDADLVAADPVTLVLRNPDPAQDLLLHPRRDALGAIDHEEDAAPVVVDPEAHAGESEDAQDDDERAKDERCDATRAADPREPVPRDRPHPWQDEEEKKPPRLDEIEAHAHGGLPDPSALGALLRARSISSPRERAIESSRAALPIGSHL